MNLGIGRKGESPLCPIVLFPASSSTPLEPDQDGLATNWSPRTGLPADLPARHEPRPRPARSGFAAALQAAGGGGAEQPRPLAGAIIRQPFRLHSLAYAVPVLVIVFVRVRVRSQ
jgi:hypothetical protein